MANDLWEANQKREISSIATLVLILCLTCYHVGYVWVYDYVYVEPIRQEHKDLVYEHETLIQSHERLVRVVNYNAKVANRNAEMDGRRYR